MITCTRRAMELLGRSLAAARRFDPGAGIRVSRGGDGVVFGLAAGPRDGDTVVEGHGFVLWVEPGLVGTVDVAEPHDRLVLLAPGADAP